MRTSMLTRRGFVRRAGAHAGGLTVAAVAGGALVLDVAGARYAYALEALEDGQAATLLEAARVLFPHRRLGEEAYAAVVAALDSDAAKDPEVQRLLTDGIDALNVKAGGDWLGADRTRQTAAMEELEGTPFFNTLHFKTVSIVYDRPDVWAALGYQGPSYDDGGYLHRGFNDLAWLPDPPPEAQGPVEG